MKRSLSPFFNDDYDDETNFAKIQKVERRNEGLLRVVATSYFKPAWYELTRVVGYMHSFSFIYNNNNT